MDRHEQQLGRNNIRTKAIAFKEDGPSEYSTEIRKNDNGCICLTLQDQDFTYDTIQECKGICAKQNINIYIENYKSGANNPSNYNYNPVKMQTYPYKKAYKIENKDIMSNSMYKDHMFTDASWKNAANKVDNNMQWSAIQNNCLNFTCYPVMNNSPQYTRNETSYPKRHVENKSSESQMQEDMSTVNDSHFCSENNNYMCIRTVDTGKVLVNQTTDHKSPFIVARTKSSSNCKNLYVAPPYFTVDKFVNQTHPKTNRGVQQCGQFSQQMYDNQKLPLNIDINYNNSDKLVQTKPSLIQANYGNSVIGVNFLEDSVCPISLDGAKQVNSAYIKTEYSNYENRYGPSEDTHFPIEENIHINVRNIVSPNKNKDYIQSFTNAKPCQMVNSTLDTNTGPYIGGFNEIGSHYARNEKSLTQVMKNVSRETKKPNYRELINHVHAIRNTISEDDLNMQIIKRTLNYNQEPKNAPSVRPPKMMDIILKNQNDTNACIFKNSIHIEKVKEKSSLNICVPLDLSTKTIKTQADSTENNPKCQTFSRDPIYPPKLNFKPNFCKTTEVLPNFEDKNRQADKRVMRCMELNKKMFADDVNKVNNPSICCKQIDSDTCNKNANIDYRLKNELKLETSMTPIKGNIVYSLQNCIDPQTYLSQDNKQGRGIKLEVTLKRTIPFNEENEYAHKKMRFENVCRSEFDTCDRTQTKTCSLISQMELKTISSAARGPLTLDNLAESKAFEMTKTDRTTQLPQPKAIELNNTRDAHIRNKQDSSSYMTSRIRTKAELKGFTFQDNNFLTPHFEKEKKDDLNSFDIYLSVQIDDVDLNKWGDTCNDFANQLANRYKTVQLIDDEKEQNLDVSKSSVEEVLVSQSGDHSQLEKKIRENIAVSTEKNNQVEIIAGNSVHNSTQMRKTDFKIDHLERWEGQIESNIKPGNNNVKENIFKNEICRGSNISVCNGTFNNNTVKYHTRNKYKDKGSIKIPKVGDLTKMSVVRLKRERYNSKRYFQSEKSIKDKDKYVECSRSQTHKTRLTASLSCPHHSRSKFKKCLSRKKDTTTSKAEEPKVFEISTRSRNQRSGTKHGTFLIGPKNELYSSHGQTFDNVKDDSAKIYLEVYKYKRALKIPPNLITINTPVAQKMSCSLPDLDADFQKDILENETQSDICKDKNEETPKSIIDVLHSRVVKSKNRTKRLQKQKNDQCPTRLIPDCTTVEHCSEDLNCNKNKTPNSNYRNVFETQVLTSRTRMEYKMQLNKEIIREIFHGNERPASAPPEITNINNNIESNYKNCDQQVCFKNDYIFENRSNVVNSKQIERTNQNVLERRLNKNNDNQLIELRKKCGGKRAGRTYRRKFSSGFDYLKKKKKSNTHALLNQSKFKRKDTDFFTSFKLKNEKDVVKEIQKWVLNKSVGQSALHKAARLGYIDVIVYCLEKMKLNPNHKDNAGYTPLHDACVNGNIEIAKLLLQYGANHSEGAHSGIRPLHEASENGHIEIVRMLLSYGADPLLETYSGQSPLKLASDANVNDFFLMHLRDLQLDILGKVPWRFPGPWKLFDDSESGYDILDTDCQNSNSRSDVDDADIFFDTSDGSNELFEFEEAGMPLPPLYLLKDEGMEKWVLLNDLCSLLKVKSKDTLLHKIFPSISSATVSRVFLRELKMCEFLEKATCLQLLCAGEKINICHSKVVLIQYNENVRKLLGVNTIFMKF